MTAHTLTLEEAEKRSVRDLLNDISEQHSLIIVMPDGRELIILPKPELKPLPVLEGSVPRNWKKAIYNDSE